MRALAGAMALVAATFAVYPWAGNAWTMGACATVLGLALAADVVVSNADSATTYRELVAPEDRRRWTDRRCCSCSHC